MSEVVRHRRSHAAASNPEMPRLSVEDLAARHVTLADLESFVPQTRAEARALADARARLSNGRRTRSAGARGAGARGATDGMPPVPTPSTTQRVDADLIAFPTRASLRAAGQLTPRRAAPRRTARRPQPGAAFTRPKQAAAALAVIGVLGAAQSSAASGGAVVTAPSPAADTTLAQLAIPHNAALLLDGTSRSGGRVSLAAPETTEDAAPDDAGPVAPDDAVAAEEDGVSDLNEQALRRADATQALAAQRGAAEAAEAAALAAQAAEAAAALAREQELARFALVRPIEAPVISGFGYRIHPVYRVSRLHTGLDYSAACGRPIVAAEDGKVVESGWNGGYGNDLVIDHGTVNGQNIRTRYAHMSRKGLPVGTVVAKGDQVGLVGTTGTSTGCHLHFEVEVNGQKVNPNGYL